jgi:hypothetical protein
MQIRPIAYLCVALLTFNLVDDYLFPAPASLTSPFADEDNEYLSPTLGQGCQRSSPRQEPVLAALKPRGHELSFAPGHCPPQFDVTARFAPPPLYIFMSLQI